MYLVINRKEFSSVSVKYDINEKTTDNHGSESVTVFLQIDFRPFHL